MHDHQPEMNGSENTPVVLFHLKNERKPLNACLACGQEYESFKESIQCCAELD